MKRILPWLVRWPRCTIAHQSGQAVVLGYLSLNVCLCPLLNYANRNVVSISPIKLRLLCQLPPPTPLQKCWKSLCDWAKPLSRWCYNHEWQNRKEKNYSLDNYKISVDTVIWRPWRDLPSSCFSPVGCLLARLYRKEDMLLTLIQSSRCREHITQKNTGKNNNFDFENIYLLKLSESIYRILLADSFYILWRGVEVLVYICTSSKLHIRITLCYRVLACDKRPGFDSLPRHVCLEVLYWRMEMTLVKSLYRVLGGYFWKP